MAKRIDPIGRVVGGRYDDCFLFWLMDKDGTETFAISPKQSLRISAFVRLEDNPIAEVLTEGDIVRVTKTDEAFLHEDLDLYTKNCGKVPVRLNKQASEKLQSWAKKK